ncbi:O-antigen ligase family protein [Butyrivibrio sp. AE3006]|uniref:O-antigen ligase family protein n=1 Tax=Butyrivibrio sp. AE3006 TaxID=1280673 RepID=UPI00040044C3|nr:O-antigen ligase family protein [Butyrivibrio sp. AE3006]
MRRTVVTKQTAARAVIILFALLTVLSVFPFRIWQRTISEHSDAEVTSVSDRVNDYHDVVQKFIAQYDRIESIDVFVNELERGQYMSVVVYKPTMEVLYERYVYLGDKTIPGYVTIPLELDLEVGETYTILLNGCFSSYKVGYSTYDPARFPYVLSFAYHDTEVGGVSLTAVYNYEQPITKKASLLIILATIVVAAILCLLVSVVYGGKRNKLVTVHRVIRFVGNPIAVAITAILMVMIFPLKIFDERMIDIVFYEVGVLICGFFMLYAINHENDATLDVKLWHNALNFIKMSTIAAAVWFCCEYMNAFYTIFQSIAERKEIICLLIFLCLFIPREKVLKIYNLIYCAVAVVAGAVYRNTHLMADTEKEYDLHNAATTYGVVIVILFGFLLLNILIEIVRMVKDRGSKKGTKTSLTVMAFITVLLFAAMALFRNTRWWGVVLAAFVLLLMFCYGRFCHADKESRKGYPELVMGGLLLNFVVSMLYCWAYRMFPAFNTGRFPFVFHTVTVTAEYMTAMECVSMVLLAYKIYDTRDIKRFGDRFRYLWKEFILFGFVSAYMIFTISRTSYLACIVMFLFVCIVTTADNKKGKLMYFLRQVVTMAFAVILCFPAAFTMQRILPAISAHPKTFIIEGSNPGLNGGGNPGSTLFMNVERFADLFCEKILGADLINYNYPEDKYNYDEKGRPIYGQNGVKLTEVQAEFCKVEIKDLLESALTSEDDKQYLLDTAGYELGLDQPQEEEETVETVEVTEEAPQEQNLSDGIEEFSNGRITIFKSYLQQMNLWGHEEMGAELPSGEIAVHAHNTYLQVMYDNGIITGILFAGLVLISIVSGWLYYRRYKGEIPGALLPGAMTVCFAVASISEWVFQLSNPMTIALMLSLMPLCMKEQKK